MSTPELDREVDLRRILRVAAGLLVLALVVHVLVWFLIVGFRRAAQRQDPPPSPLPEANAPHLPPGPLLQTDPVGEIRELRAEEEARLRSYGWVDRERGVVWLPIERAMAILAERGTAGARPLAPPPPATADGTPGPGRAAPAPAPVATAGMAPEPPTGEPRR